ncbi:uncharacterized protein FMAN_08492 [Fusarium mangiferae]|uniref:Uncharacterized protein n=1 Tax=Fusarium mangiferae TaxID=192010 RepID=A0A1L7TTZ0_FUSMA|nr:uncharacterized protein FMAN_08492 [Fusarium mangiferae]CVK98701.1 uncharacterized protein FMAN_08492 [Fusarium mangiferae]
MDSSSLFKCQSEYTRSTLTAHSRCFAALTGSDLGYPTSHLIVPLASRRLYNRVYMVATRAIQICKLTGHIQIHEYSILRTSTRHYFLITMSQNSSASSTPPSTATPGEHTAVIETSNDINGPEQLANKVCRCPCVCQEVCRSDDYYCDPCIEARHNYLPPGLDKSG